MISPHPLKVWIDANTTQAKFARAIECSASHLSDIVKGHKRVSLALAYRIARETNNAVSVDAIAARMPSKAVPADPQQAVG